MTNTWYSKYKDFLPETNLIYDALNIRFDFLTFKSFGLGVCRFVRISVKLRLSHQASYLKILLSKYVDVALTPFSEG